MADYLDQAENQFAGTPSGKKAMPPPPPAAAPAPTPATQPAPKVAMPDIHSQMPAGYAAGQGIANAVGGFIDRARDYEATPTDPRMAAVMPMMPPTVADIANGVTTASNFVRGLVGAKPTDVGSLPVPSFGGGASSPITNAAAATPSPAASAPAPSNATQYNMPPPPTDRDKQFKGLGYDVTNPDGSKTRVFDNSDAQYAASHGNGNMSVIPASSFVNPTGASTGSPSGMPTVSGGNYNNMAGEDERKSIMDMMMADRANRQKQTAKYASMADWALQAGHKRAAAGYTALANTFDKGTPDFSPYMRWQRGQTPAQMDYSESLAQEKAAQAQGESVQTQTRQRIMQLAEALQSEKDPARAANIARTIDALQGKPQPRTTIQQMVGSTTIDPDTQTPIRNYVTAMYDPNNPGAGVQYITPNASNTNQLPQVTTDH